jgi:hypothetical protein
MSQHVITLIESVLIANGYKLESASMEGPDLYLLKVVQDIQQPQESPPDLGVHVVDRGTGKGIMR